MATAIEKAQQVQQDFLATAERIRGRKQYTDAAKAQMLAKAYTTAKATLDDLQSQDAADADADRGRLYQRAFGTAGLPGDPGSLIVSVRDALDRAERLETPADAATLLTRAELSGDEPLARAVAGHAFAQRNAKLADPAWADVVNQYASRRPSQAAAISELAEMTGSDVLSHFMRGSAFLTPLPPELSHIPPSRLGALAADPLEAA